MVFCACLLQSKTRVVYQIIGQLEHVINAKRSLEAHLTNVQVSDYTTHLFYANGVLNMQ